MICRFNRVAAGLAFAFMFAAAALNPASAQDLTNAARPDFNAAYPPERLALLQRATDLMGAEVRNRDGRRLGRIADFVVDCTSWRVVCALIAPANLYGPAEYLIAVPPRCFLSSDTNSAVLDVALTNLLEYQPFKSDDWDAAAVRQSLKQSYERFKQPVFWGAPNALGQLARCSSVLDLDVNTGTVNAGRLADLMLDLTAERVMFAIIAFYGSDANLHALPPSVLTPDTNQMDFQLKMDPVMTGALVDRQEYLWLDLTDPRWAAGDYRAYGGKVVFDTAADAGLTAEARRLVRDYAPPPPPSPPPPPPGILTAQSPDAEITRNVWKAILAADVENGFAAQGVKVSTVNGKVTLTGRVAKDKDRGGFGTIAEGVAGAGNVKNELEVGQ